MITLRRLGLLTLSGLGLLAARLVEPAADVMPIAGYAGRVHGEVLHYHSPLPEVEHSLLVRSLDAERSIAWETAAVPADYTGDEVTFIWMFGIHAGSDRHAFELRLAGETWFTFHNPPNSDVRDWSFDGPQGSQLRFRATLVDRFDDLMGFATLRLPRSACRPGEPLVIEVAGETAGSRAWYMTFQETVAEGARIIALPALERSPGGLLQPLRLTVLHLAEPTQATIQTTFGAPREVTLQLGGNVIELGHPAVTEPANAEVNVRIGERVLHNLALTVQPVRPWSVDLVQHTHTDVGYTRPQTEILPEHLRYIDTALDFCDQTDGYPEEARFRWTCETSWAVREYVESRTPEQLERLRRRVSEGRIALTGMFLNMSEVVDEASYAAFLRPVRALREEGLEVRSAMQNDINGASWCLADYAADLGLDSLTMGQHGHRALIPFAVPTSFWWESPAGNRLLAYRADHYQTGNFWGVHTGKVEVVEEELLRYLAGLEAGGYPFERVAVQHSGYPTDNSPPSTAASELVRAWNERYVWPRLRCALSSELPDWVREHHADQLPVVRAAWPDWWTDGFGSAPRESGAARVTQARLAAVEALLAYERLRGLPVPTPLAREAQEIRDALLFYGEHTFGAAESITEPLSENSMVQWAEKAAYAWDAVKRTAVLSEGALARMQALVAPARDAQLVVFNGLGFQRGGLLELFVDHELLPLDRPWRLIDGAGAALPVQLLRSRPEGSYWAIHVDPVPAFSLRGWRVLIDPRGERPPVPPPLAADTLENRHFRLVVSDSTGGITSLYDKGLDVELVDSDSPWHLGQLVHEQLADREQLEAFTLERFSRSGLTDVVVEGVVPGPIWDALAVRGELPGCEGPGGLRCELRLFHREPRVELHFTAHKRRVYEPEALYVAFPFQMPEARLVYETLGGVVEPEAGGILPGASSDWQAMQDFVAVRSPRGQLVLTSDEVALIQLGGLNIGRFAREARVERPHVFSWVMNNYWTTNFVAAPEGELSWSYALTTGADPSSRWSARAGRADRSPLLARLVPAAQAGVRATAGPQPGAPGLPPLPANLMLVAARPAAFGDGVVLHVREVEGQPARWALADISLDGVLARLSLVNVAEEVLETPLEEVTVEAWEPKFLLLEPR